MSPSLPAPTPVLYLAGLGRSGSTLLERTLARLPGVVAVGEMVHLWERGVVLDERCGCGRRFGECEFWGEVGERAFGGWDGIDAAHVLALKESIDRTRFVPRQALGTEPGDFAVRADELAAVLGPLYAAISATAGGDVVIDSSKNPSYAYLLRRSPELELKVVHAVRDAPAVAYAWTKTVRRPDADESLMGRWTPRYTAMQWVGQNLAASALGRDGTPVALVRYEDFVADPAGTVERLLADLDLPRPGPEDPLMAGLRSGHIDMGIDHTVSGNPMRFETGRITISEDTSWRERLPPSDRRLVAAMTAPVRRQLGYLAR